jgi:hypothetical protein
MRAGPYPTATTMSVPVPGVSPSRRNRPSPPVTAVIPPRSIRAEATGAPV